MAQISRAANHHYDVAECTADGKGTGRRKGGVRGSCQWSSICFCYPIALEASSVLEEHECVFFFPLYNTAKKKKGSRTEVGLSILNKDNLTVA